ncbi:coiled-coil domain-containing protein 183-like [Centroberyx affinis]|uniref:coiled-coil domain-containing protein 183-like n=1 Tax=Centroberyx affinis TaxID=166261 RepID=UPI003A5C6BC7
MDFLSDADAKDAATLQEHRRRIQKLEKQIQEEESAARQILDGDDKPPRCRKPLFKSLPKPGGLTVESKLEQDQRQMRILINEHNRLKFAVRDRESQLLEVEEALKHLEPQTQDDKSEHTYSQLGRQLENSLEKMRIKITEAEKIHNTYLHIHEHLQQETQQMPMVLEQSAVTVGQTEVDQVSKMSQSAVAAADSTTGKLVQMERETTEEKRRMESELRELRAVKEEMEGRMEKDWDHRSSSRSQDRLKESKKEAEASTAPVRAQQSCVDPSTSQSNIRLMEDIKALRDALGCTHLQELVKKLVSQRATEDQLHIQMSQYEDLVKQRTDTLADLELQYARLKFTVGPGSTRFDKLEEQMEAELQKEDNRVRRVQVELKKAEDTLDSVEQGVANLYYMTCVPVEELPIEDSMDAMHKLRDINARLPMLLSRKSGQKCEDSSLQQEKVWSFLEQSNMMEQKNYKRASSPVDTFQPCSDEEDCSPSREEIKHHSVKLIEAQQNKKSQKRGRKR